MRKLLLVLLTTVIMIQPSFAWSWNTSDCEEKAIKKLLNSQIKYANNTNFNKFINTYDPKYKNSDGFNLDVDERREVMKNGVDWIRNFAEEEKEKTGIKNRITISHKR